MTSTELFELVKPLREWWPEELFYGDFCGDGVNLWNDGSNPMLTTHATLIFEAAFAAELIWVHKTVRVDIIGDGPYSVLFGRFEERQFCTGPTRIHALVAAMKHAKGIP